MSGEHPKIMWLRGGPKAPPATDEEDLQPVRSDPDVGAAKPLPDPLALPGS